MKSNDYLKLGFSYICEMKSHKGNIIIEITIFYHGEEIHYERVNRRTDCDKLFSLVCKNFLRNERINNLGL